MQLLLSVICHLIVLRAAALHGICTARHLHCTASALHGIGTARHLHCAASALRGICTARHLHWAKCEHKQAPMWCFRGIL
jgi:hypothetical protein